MIENNINEEKAVAARIAKAEAARLLRLSIKSLERRMKLGQITYQKDGRLVFFTAADIQQYMSSRKIRACGVPAR